MDKSDQPKIGLALSGASARSVFYVGFLEVLKENNIPINYISANSGSCIVAAAFACGTLESLKQQIFELDKELLFSIIQRSKNGGGIYNMDKVEAELRKYTKNLRFEDVQPRLGFACTNINTGEQITLSIGDIAKAICASCALPGLFQPIRWGSWDLVDGGLIHTIPVGAARAAGCDYIIGIDLTSRPYVFSKLEIGIKRLVDFFYFILGIGPATRAFNAVVKAMEKSSYFSYFMDIDEPEKPQPGMFEVLGRAIDISLNAQKTIKQVEPDLLVKSELPFVPGWKRILYLHFADLDESKKLYQQGREAALKYLPQIQKALRSADERGSNLNLNEQYNH